MDVFIGHDRLIPEGSWFPVVVELQNDGPAFNGQFELTPGRGGQGQVVSMKLELPTSTLKRFVLPVFAGSRYAGTWDARLLDEKNRMRAESTDLQVRQLSNWPAPLYGAIASTVRGLPSFPEFTARAREFQPAVARIQANLVPENPIPLQGLQAIYLNSERALELNVPQATALLSWVYTGGHLIVGVEQPLEVRANEWLRNLLPCEIDNLVHVQEHRALQQFTISSDRLDHSMSHTPSGSVPLANPYAGLPEDPAFESQPLQAVTLKVRDGTILCGSADAPLIVSGRRGRGQVTVLTFSPEREPFLSWSNRPSFWAKLMAVDPSWFASPRQTGRMMYSIDGLFGAMVDSRQVRKLPVGWLLLLLTAYLVVIGPLDRYWLKKINRQMFTWVTFPFYVVAFSGLIYVIGHKLRAGEIEWNELHVVDLIPWGQQGQWRGWTFASLYSPANARYKLGSGEPYAALRPEYLRHSSYGGSQEGNVRVEQRGHNFLAEVSVPVWTSQLYVADWMHRALIPLRFSVSTTSNGWIVEVHNGLDRPLNPVHAVIAGVVIPLGELPPRQTKVLNVSKNAGTSLDSYTTRLSSQFGPLLQARQQAFGGNRLVHDVPQTAMATCLLDPLSGTADPNSRDFKILHPPGFNLGGLIARGDNLLLAWVKDYSPIEPLRKFTARRGHTDTLLRISAPAQQDSEATPSAKIQ